MPTNLLLLPLLGGFWFVHFCYFFRFRAQRLDGYRLLLESAFFGLLLIVPARLITYYGPQYLELGRQVQAEWGKLWNAPLSGTATLSLLLGLVAPLVINWLHATNRRLQSEEMEGPVEPLSGFLLPAKDHALEIAIKSSGTYLHQLLLKSVLQETPILVTLQNRKVYVGYVAEMPNLRLENQYIWLLPVLSGYREDKSLKVCFELIYPDPEGLPEDMEIAKEDMLLTIPMSEVKSATLYHRDLESLILPYSPPEKTPEA
jgi:hypothetical protein